MKKQIGRRIVVVVKPHIDIEEDVNNDNEWPLTEKRLLLNGPAPVIWGNDQWPDHLEFNYLIEHR